MSVILVIVYNAHVVKVIRPTVFVEMSLVEKFGGRERERERERGRGRGRERPHESRPHESRLCARSVVSNSLEPRVAKYVFYVF